MTSLLTTLNFATFAGSAANFSADFSLPSQPRSSGGVTWVWRRRGWCWAKKSAMPAKTTMTTYRKLYWKLQTTDYQCSILIGAAQILIRTMSKGLSAVLTPHTVILFKVRDPQPLLCFYEAPHHRGTGTGMMMGGVWDPINSNSSRNQCIWPTSLKNWIPYLEFVFI